jgi:hypothetical protein
MAAIAPRLRARLAQPAIARPAPLAIAAFASLAAGAIHAAAIGAHSELPDVQKVFMASAAFQLGWGALALTRPHRALIALGVLGNLALLAGWFIVMNGGVAFVEGMDTDMSPSKADSMAAALAAVAAVSGAVAITLPALGARLDGAAVLMAGAACVGLGISGMAAAAVADDHDHGGGAGDGHAAVEARPYDPALPIDLGGVPGVTPAQQAAAENLVSATLLALPHWADYRTAEAEGFRSIGDGASGVEHFVNWNFAADDNILDPYHPESLMYSTLGGERRLVAAMYMAKPGTTLDNVPELGGALTQWHIHNDLCFLADSGADGFQVGGLTDVNGNCAPGLIKLPATAMIHVWITPHKCGPFAALEGIGGGQIAEGETRLCDTAHGTP